MNLFVVTLVAALAAPAASPAADAPGDRILGEWRGSSTCTNLELLPACKDESVRYVFTAVPGASARYHVVADKLVAGEYQTMGEMDFDYVAAEALWVHDLHSSSCAQCRWWYRIDGAELVGGLTGQGGAALRKVSARRHEP